jgi:hypothetical protein
MILFSVVGGYVFYKIMKPVNERILQVTFDPLVRRAENIRQGRDPNYEVPMTEKDIKAIKEFCERVPMTQSDLKAVKEYCERKLDK